MGARGNIAIVQHPPFRAAERIYLYTHWRGGEIPIIVKHALASPAGQECWDDEAYLARILFEALVGSARGGDSGFGISSYICDNEYPVIVLDCDEQELWVEGDKGMRLGTPLSFERYVSLSDGTAMAFRDQHRDSGAEG